MKLVGIAFEVLIVVVLLYFGTLYGSQILSHPSEVFSTTIYKVLIVLGVLILVFMIARIFSKKERL
ncbi:MAG: hypothetical protein ACE5HY_04300 [Candidatus Hydrothermarchaeales archaeon]